MKDGALYIVTKIEQEDGKFLVHAQDADLTKKKRRKVSCNILDPTSFYVGQKVRVVLEDAG